MATKTAQYIFLLIISASPVSADFVTLRSPDGTVALTVLVAPQLAYSVIMDDQPVVLESPLQLEFNDGSTLSMPLELVDHHITSTDHRWSPVVGRKEQIRDHHNQVVLVLREKNGLKRRC